MKDKNSLKEEVMERISWDDVEILVIGAGLMGTGITQVYAQSGFNVGFVDVNDEIIQSAFERVGQELVDAQKAGIFSEIQIKDMKKRILAATSYEKACQGKNLKLVIETATEDIEIKKQIFRRLDELCAPPVILASNSSSLDVNILARETRRPDKVVWMHFFYPAHKNRAGEYAGTDTASPESIEAAAKYMKLAGKVATPILSSRKGGAADIIFVSLLLEAARMVDEGFDVSHIEAAGKKAFSVPIGFLSLMDANGIPLGVITMFSFSDSSSPDDPLYKVYDNFFTPPESYRKLFKKYQNANDKSSVRWVSDEEAQKEAKDLMLIDILKKRFLAVAFMTSVEVVDAGVIEMEEVDQLCQNAFLWKEGPFALMNKMGIHEVMRIVTERMELSHRKEINFPIPELLITQVQKNEAWPIVYKQVNFCLEREEKTARIMISNPRTSNALDNQVFEDLKKGFQKAYERDTVEAVIFDSAPIKTFIAGAYIPHFIHRIMEQKFQELKDDVSRWHDIVFHEMTGKGKPKIALVDGAALGGGAEVALAFAYDLDSIVVATDRTSYAFPETRLGIYPGLRGTLLLPQLIYKATGDAELAGALSKYYILTGGMKVFSPRLIKYLGLADFVIPARKRDEVAEILAQAIIDNGGKPLSPEQIASLKIEELPSALTFEEKEELRGVKDLFLKKDIIPALYTYSQGQTDLSLSEESKACAEKIAPRVARNSPHAVEVSNLLISQGFDGFLNGKSLDDLAQWELENTLIPVFKHPDALEGLTSFVKRRSPQFTRG